MLRPLVASFLLSLPLFAGTLEVTSTADSGAGSLRAAMEAANAGSCGEPCSIAFRIPGPVPDTGYFTIRPQSLLPYIEARDVTIDGFTQSLFTGETNRHGPEIELDGTDAGLGPGLKYVRTYRGLIRGLAINRFQGNGIVVDGGNGTHAIGNFVGMDPAGVEARPNGGNGILFIRSDITYVAGNTVGGNRGNGLFFHSSNGTIANNRIGVGRSAAFAIPNGASGMDVSSPLAIDSNLIAFNALHGILASPGARLELVRNRIYGNGLLSIANGADGIDENDELDADAGPNGRQNAPVIASAHATAEIEGTSPGRVVVSGSIRSKPDTRVVIQLYASPHRNELGFAEARVWLGTVTVTTDRDGNATFTTARVFGDTVVNYDLIANGWVTATATTADGTSELANPMPLPATAHEVTTTRDEGAGSLREVLAAVNSRTCSEREPCWITFHVPGEELIDGVARFEPRTPLPAIANPHVIIDGASQAWYTGERPEGHAVELRGSAAGAGAHGLHFTGNATLFVRDVAVGGFDGDGFRVAFDPDGPADAELRNVFSGTDATGTHALPNGHGVSMSGGSGFVSFSARTAVRLNGGTYSGNRGDGLRLEGRWYLLHGVRAGVDPLERPLGNGGHGIYAGASSFVSINDSIAAHNGGDGVASAPGTRVAVEVRTYANGGLGIDRNDDGVTPNDESDDVTDAPELLSAEYDAARDMTVILGRVPASIPPFPNATPFRWVVLLRFFTSAEPDPSGRGEGASYLGHVTSHIRIEGDSLFAEFPGDLRGRFVTAVRTVTYCDFNFGCIPFDTSEHSNGVEVR